MLYCLPNLDESEVINFETRLEIKKCESVCVITETITCSVCDFVTIPQVQFFYVLALLCECPKKKGIVILTSLSRQGWVKACDILMQMDYIGLHV